MDDPWPTPRARAGAFRMFGPRKSPRHTPRRSPMARSDKAAAVAELAEEFRGSAAVVLTEYRGLTVKQLTELRRSLGGNASYAVVKNTLTKIAAQEAGVEGIDDHLVGPSAIAFVKGDPVDAAKGLRDFARANPVLVIKGGVLDGKPLSADEIKRLADLESRERGRSRFWGTRPRPRGPRGAPRGRRARPPVRPPPRRPWSRTSSTSSSK